MAKPGLGGEFNKRLLVTFQRGFVNLLPDARL